MSAGAPSAGPPIVWWDEPGDPRLAAVRVALDASFDGDFSDDDWAHALGGRHFAIIGDDGAVRSHAAVVPRTLRVGERALRAGYVEAVATVPAHRRRGLAGALMGAIGAHLAAAYELGALSTGSHDFYARFGWRRWRGPTWCLVDGRRVRTADEDDGIMVLTADPAIELSAPLACEHRAGAVW